MKEPLCIKFDCCVALRKLGVLNARRSAGFTPTAKCPRARSSCSPGGSPREWNLLSVKFGPL